MDYQDQHRKILGGWATSHRLDHEIFDGTTVVNSTEPGLGNRLTSCGAALWSTADGVHLSLEGYRDMAMGLIDLFKTNDQTGSNDESSSTSSASHKRRRPEIVVTVPAKKCTGGNAGAPAMAEWVTGRRERSAGADWRLGEREPPKRGKNPIGGEVGGDPGGGASGKAKGDKTFSKTIHNPQK
jgi:hypothetical protein